MSNPSAPLAGKLSPDDLITLNDEIAGMAKAGLPLDQGLAGLAAGMGRGRLREVTKQLADDLRAGMPLPAAIDRQKGRVPPFYAALLSAGIRSGRIGDVLGTLTLYARSIADFRDAVISALLYPAIVLLIGIGLLVFVGFIILPEFVDIFDKFRLSLPALTEALVFIGKNPLPTLVLPVAGVVGVIMAAWLLLRLSPGGRMLWARFVYSVPLVGTLIRSARLAAFADLLGILVDQAVPLPESLGLAAAASSDPLLVEGARRIESDLSDGVPLGTALRKQDTVPILVAWMIGLGEKRGTLGPALHQVEQLYRRQTEVRAALLKTVLPPLFIICIASTIGVLFIFGLMAPLIGLFDGLSGGLSGRRR